MSPQVLLGWGLAVAAVAAGYVSYGLPGVLLAISVIVFWLLLQFSRALRTMRIAAGRPVGHVDNAVMLQSRLRTGVPLAQVMRLTRSFGEKRGEETATAPEIWAWRDAGGDEVQVELKNGRVVRWALQRAAPAPDA